MTRPTPPIMTTTRNRLKFISSPGRKTTNRKVRGACASDVASVQCERSISLLFFLKKKIWVDICPLCGAIDSVVFGVLTSALGFKARVDSLTCILCCLCPTDSLRSPLVQHLLTSWLPSPFNLHTLVGWSAGLDLILPPSPRVNKTLGLIHIDLKRTRD